MYHGLLSWCSYITLHWNERFNLLVKNRILASTPWWEVWYQHAKKVVSSCRGASGFCYWASEFCSQLARQAIKFFFEKFKLQKKCEISSAHQMFWGLVQKTFRLLNATFSLPKWQAAKLTFFAPWVLNKVLYGEAPPQGPTPCPFSTISDRK